MIKRTMLASLVAAFAFVALPTLALANPEIDPKGTGEFPTSFTSDGGQTTFESAGGLQFACEEVENEGVFENATTGSVKLHFYGCEEPTFGIPCNTPGRGEGEITTTTLPFHLVTADHEPATHREDAVLITPGAKTNIGGTELGHFATFECSFLVTVNVVGNGVIGTITKPATNTESTEATLSFEASSTGVQTHRKITGSETEYDLKTIVNGDHEHPETTGIVGTDTLTFPDQFLYT